MIKRFLLLGLIGSLVIGGVSAQVDTGGGKGGQGATNPVAIAEEPPADAEVVQAMVANGADPVVVGDLILDESFNEEDSWELYDSEDFTLTISDGRYFIFSGLESKVMWGQNTAIHRDVVIQVQAEQLSASDNNGYGVMCRADPANTLDGYHFWISGEGSAAIVISVGGSAEYLEEWVRADSINRGEAINQITAVCVGDYLALYVNGQLAVETNDSTYSQGVAGMSVVGYEADEGAQVGFDYIRIWEASGDSPSSNNGPSSIRSLSTSEEALLPDLTRLLAEGNQNIDIDGLLLYEQFDSQEAWELYDDGDSSMVIDDGHYTITHNDNSIMWGQNRDVHRDVVIQVDTEQISSEINNGYGLMCRADPANNLDGYHFMISGDGFYSILAIEGDETNTLVEWTRTDTINLGEARNTITAVCVGDYLALYVNGTLVDEVNDNTFERGAAGLTAIVFEENQTVEINFDNVRIWNAR